MYRIKNLVLKKKHRMFKMVLLFALLIVALYTLFAIVNNKINPSNSSASETGQETWAIWWYKSATPWALSNVGGMQFLDYNRTTDKTKLEAEFKSFVDFHKPTYLKIYVDDMAVLIPYIVEKSDAPKPTENNTLSVIMPATRDYDYFDDVIELARKNGIKTIIYFAGSPYGGAAVYPYTYYSSVGWFWCRPDWGGDLSVAETKTQKLNKYCIADPRTDAMRYPPAVTIGNSCYNFTDNASGKKHATETTDGLEFNGINTWRVYEDKDMVFSLQDLALEGGQRPIHRPIPSISSQQYRNYLTDLYSETADHFKNNSNVFGYQLFQEPSYAHLREQLAYRSEINNNPDSCKATNYQVDYSQAELEKFNTWLSNVKKKSKVDKIPYPVTDDYIEFREWNLINFQKELKQAILSKDSDAKILLSIFIDEDFVGLGTNIDGLLSGIKPDYVTVEHPDYFDVNSYLGFRDGNLFESGYASEKTRISFGSSQYPKGMFDYLKSSLKKNSPNTTIFFSHWWKDTARDAQILDIGIDVVVPGFSVTKEGVGHYPHWYSNTIAISEYTSRYNSSAVKCIPNCTATSAACDSDGCGAHCNESKCSSVNSPTPESNNNTSADEIDCGPLDVNSDNEINIYDFEGFKKSYQQECIEKAYVTNCGPKDTNNDGIIDIKDFARFVKYYQSGVCGN